MKRENKRHAPDGKTCTVPALRLSHDLKGKEKGKLLKGKRMIFERKRKRIDVVLTLPPLQGWASRPTIRYIRFRVSKYWP